MAKADSTTYERPRGSPPTNGHDLVAVTEWLPGDEPTDYDIDLSGGHASETHYWRCRKCGQERNNRDEFAEDCEFDLPPNPVLEGGYSVEDARTRRALTENMTVRFAERGPVYEVDSESENTYEVDTAAETFSCPDHAKRETFCRHLRRVDLEIRAPCRGRTGGSSGSRRAARVRTLHPLHAVSDVRARVDNACYHPSPERS